MNVCVFVCMCVVFIVFVCMMLVNVLIKFFVVFNCDEDYV